MTTEKFMHTPKLNLKESSTDSLIFSLLETLTLESKLHDLSLYDLQIKAEHPGIEVGKAFESNPLLPGVVLTEQGQFLGMISRRQFLKYMSRPYGLELFSKRPIKNLYLLARVDHLILPNHTLIVNAAQQALQRSPELLYEPIVVEIEPEVYRLLDMHQLLIAQSYLHVLANELISNLYKKLEQANHELHRLATLDALTQIANRRLFDEYLEIEWRRMAREQQPLALIMCDVDYFKIYNDTYGHLAGDACLQQVAKVLRDTIKRPADFVARYGGEEFAVILPNTEDSGAVHVAEKIRVAIKALAIPHVNSKVCSGVTISLGVATLVPPVKTSPEILIKAADEALYQAKAAGRDRYILHLS